MGFLSKKTTWTNRELVVIKICIGSAYLLAGAYFHNFVIEYYPAFLVLFGVTVIWAMYLYISKLRNKDQ